MGERLLIDHGFRPVKLTLVESADGKGKIVARGEFARAGIATENKRVYPRSLWERELSSLREAIERRKVFGELDHPNDGRTMLKRVSHIITGLELDGDVVIGEAEILDTTNGKDLKAILQGGGAVGVSSRGYGTTSPGPDGTDVVGEDYRLMTFDFVAEPANTTSYPEIHTEQKNKPTAPVVAEAQEIDMDLTKITAEDLKKANPGLVESILATATKAHTDQLEAVKGQMTQTLQAALVDVKRQALAEAKAMVASDPEVASAKIAMEQIKSALGMAVLPEDAQKVVEGKNTEISGLKTKLSESEIRIKGLEEQLSKLCDVARQAAYKYHLESKVVGHAKAPIIRQLVGDVRAYESTAAIDAKVEAIVKEIASQTKTESRLDAEKAALVEENRKLKKAVEESLQLTRDLAVTKYVGDKVHGHPQAARLRALIESKKPTSKEQVDAVYEAVLGAVAPRPTNDELERIQARLGKRRLALSESAGAPALARAAASGEQELAEDFRSLGGDMDHILAISGVRQIEG